MFNDISCGTKDNEEECLAHAKVVSLYARKFGTGKWSFIGPGAEKKWYSMEEDSPQRIWDNIAEKMLLKFAESGCPIFRATTPLPRGKLKQRTWKTVDSLCCHSGNNWGYFRKIVSANQLSLYGAVAETCEEYESLHDRSWKLDKVIGQSIVLSEIKTEVPFENDDPAYQNVLLQPYEERIERLSQQDRLSKFCTDAGFLSVVEIGQYFVTKDTYLTQFNTVACRDYTLPMEKGASQPRGWIQGNTKIWPVLEVATSYSLRSEFGFLNRDNTHPWVRISLDQISLWWIWTTTKQKFLMISSKEQALQLDVKDFVGRSKARAKTQKGQNYSLSEYEVSKKVIHLLRHSQKVHREEDGAVHFWRIEENLQSQFPQTPHWSDDRWKACLVAGGGAKRRFRYCIDDSGTICFFPSSWRTFRAQSYWSYITGQCDHSEQRLPVHLSCRMCNQFTFHHQCGIGTGRSKFEQQTDSILSACWSYGQKSQRSWDNRLEWTASCTIPAQCLEETSRRGI